MQPAVSHDGAQRRIESLDQVRPLRIYEAKLLLRKLIRQQLDLVRVQAGIALPGHIVNHHRVHIAADQRLHGKAELAVSHDAIFGHQTRCRFKIGGRHLDADDEIARHKVIHAGKAVFIHADHKLLRQVDITHRVIDDLRPLLGNGDAVSRHIVLAV